MVGDEISTSDISNDEVQDSNEVKDSPLYGYCRRYVFRRAPTTEAFLGLENPAQVTAAVTNFENLATGFERFERSAAVELFERLEPQQSSGTSERSAAVERLERLERASLLRYR